MERPYKSQKFYPLPITHYPLPITHYFLFPISYFLLCPRYPTKNRVSVAANTRANLRLH
jgi:hypothetical protein